jgi:hypothetical protein
MSKLSLLCIRRASNAKHAKSKACAFGFAVPGVHRGTAGMARCSVSEQRAAALRARPLDVTTRRALE